MNHYPQFGVLLTQYLAKLDRTPAWLARRLGVNGGTVSRWLNDGARPGNPETIVRIADILGIQSERNRLLVTAGYGYQASDQERVPDPSQPSLDVPPLHLPSLATPAPPSGTAKPRPSNLPQPLTPFIGRATEVAQLNQQLLDPTCRLLTLVGPGGIGKTRLAIEVINSMPATQTAFFDGIFFVTLAELNAPEQLTIAIAEVLELTFDGRQEISQQLLKHLQSKYLLLVLDNFEHLQEGVGLISEIVANASQVKVMVTSRTALGVPGEWFHPVGGLEVPAQEGLKVQELAAYDSARLFQQCAQQASPGFDLAAEADYVARICRFVDGMPLAIEMAAAWLRLLPCAGIAQELEQNLGSLASPLHNAPVRHRSMHFVLEQSWQLLTEHERAAMQVLTIFPGGFDAAAAVEVADADLLTLAALVQKSMIRLNREPTTLATGRARYTIHEMLRQFATTQSMQQPAARSAAAARHSRYYLRWLQRQTPQLLSAEQHVAMALIDADFDNVRAAWQWAVEHEDYATLALGLDGLTHFCVIRGRIHDCVMLLQRAIEQLQPGVDQPDVDQSNADMDPASTQLLGQILARVGAVYANVPDKTHAVPLLEQSLTYLSEPRERALVLAHLGYAISLQGEDAKAEALLHESLTISRQWNDLHVQGYALHRLSCLGWARAEHLQSRALGRESLTIYRTLGRPDRIAHVLSDLAVTETWLGDYATATVHLQESLVICRRLGYRHGEAWALNGLGFVALWQGEDLESAAALTRESLAIYQSTGHSFAMCLSFGDLAVIYRNLGEHEQAVQFGQAGVGVARTLQSDYALSHMLIFLGCAQIGSGDLVAARRTLMEAMLLARSIHHVFCMTNGLYYLAELLIEESRLTQGDAALALQCQALEWLVFLQEYPGSWHCYKRESARLATQLAAVLPAQQIAAAQAKGKMLTLSEVVHFLLNQP